MWVWYAFGSALFAGITAVLAKAGLQKTDSSVVTALRTIVVLIFACLMVYITGSQDTIYQIGTKTLVFLILSGTATGASWLCYFRAMQLGNVNQVAPVDKSSTVLTMIFAVLLLQEPLTKVKAVSMILIMAGTLLMIVKQKGVKQSSGHQWLFYAVLSAVFAALTSILAKVGINGVESNLGTAIRTAVVLIMSWLVVFATGKQKQIADVSLRSFAFIVLSGIATGASWLCYYRALQEGPASVVVPVDKLSIVVTVLFSAVFLDEHLKPRAFFGLILLVAGTLILVL